MKNKTLFLITAGILAVTVFTSIPALEAHSAVHSHNKA